MAPANAALASLRCGQGIDRDGVIARGGVRVGRSGKVIGLVVAQGHRIEVGFVVQGIKGRLQLRQTIAQGRVT